MTVAHTEYHCPNCGKQTVYVDEDDSGDYYAGTSHYCLTCHSRLPDLDQGNRDVLWKHAEYGGDPDGIRRYLEIRKGAGLADDETVRVECELAEAERMRAEQVALAREFSGCDCPSHKDQDGRITCRPKGLRRLKDEP